MKPLLAALRQGLDRVTIYLPVILTAALALGTYWLVRNAPRLAQPEHAQPVRHDPDYFMRSFVIKSFLPGGALRSELAGQEGRHYPDTDTMEVDRLRLRSVSPLGRITRASADRGLSNSDASEVQLFGHAVVVREAAVDAAGQPLPRLEFQGEFLHAFLDTERVRSHLPVVLTRGADRFTADAMDYDNMTGVANLRGRVRGLLVPGGPASPAARR